MKRKKSSAKVIRETLYVKNMVCDRCIRIVREELEKLGLEVCNIKLGEVVIEAPEKPNLLNIRSVLERNGFELIDDRRGKIIEQIKTVIINLVHHTNPEKSTRINYSAQIAKEVGLEYHYLSSLFSSIENVTIEKYLILQKIERAKELLVYNEMTLSEIAFQMGYSSVQHLSNQFKKVTGFTPSYFKSVKANKRKPLDKVGLMQ